MICTSTNPFQIFNHIHTSQAILSLLIYGLPFKGTRVKKKNWRRERRSKSIIIIEE